MKNKLLILLIIVIPTLMLFSSYNTGKFDNLWLWEADITSAEDSLTFNGTTIYPFPDSTTAVGSTLTLFGTEYEVKIDTVGTDSIQIMLDPDVFSLSANSRVYADSNRAVLGEFAGLNNSGTYLSTIGSCSGEHNSGNYLSAIGYYAGSYNSGDNVAAIGLFSGLFNSGNQVLAMGTNAANYNSGSFLSSMGSYAGDHNSGDYSIAIGDSSLAYADGSYNAAIGYKASKGTPGMHFPYQYTVSLGAGAMPTKNNQIMLGSAQTEEVYTYGTFVGDSLETSGGIFVGGNLVVTGLISGTFPDSLTAGLAIFGTINEVAVGSIGADSIQVGLPDEVLITTSLTIGDILGGTATTIDNTGISTISIATNELYVNGAAEVSDSLRVGGNETILGVFSVPDSAFIQKLEVDTLLFTYAEMEEIYVDPGTVLYRDDSDFGEWIIRYNSGSVLETQHDFAVGGDVEVTGTIEGSNLSGSNTGDEDLTTYVPYTGATTNLDMGLFDITTTDLTATGNIYSGDSDYHYFGAGNNARQYFDGTNYHVEPAYVVNSPDTLQILFSNPDSIFTADGDIKDWSGNGYDASLDSSYVVEFNGTSGYATCNQSGLGAGDFYYEYRGTIDMVNYSMYFEDGDGAVGGKRLEFAYILSAFGGNNKICVAIDDDVTKNIYQLVGADEGYASGEYIIFEISRVGSTCTWSIENKTDGTSASNTFTNSQDYSSTGQEMTIGASHNFTDGYALYANVEFDGLKVGTSSSALINWYTGSQGSAVEIYDKVGSNNLIIANLSNVTFTTNALAYPNNMVYGFTENLSGVYVPYDQDGNPISLSGTNHPAGAWHNGAETQICFNPLNIGAITTATGFTSTDFFTYAEIIDYMGTGTGDFTVITETNKKSEMTTFAGSVSVPDAGFLAFGKMHTPTAQLSNKSRGITSSTYNLKLLNNSDSVLVSVADNGDIGFLEDQVIGSATILHGTSSVSVLIIGALVTDYYFVTAKAPALGTDILPLLVSAQVDSFIVYTDNADTLAQDLPFNWLRVKGN